ncbi:MAG: tRNA(Met) cytidine acetyltransferase TmcA [Halorhodospira sp.]
MIRRTVVLEGPAAWGRGVAAARLSRGGRVRWIGASLPPGLGSEVEHCRPQGFRRVLGTTVDCLVYEAHAGLDADALGAAAGSVRGGGLLLLLTPAWSAWPSRPDPLLGRLVPAGQGREEVGTRFLQRLMATLATEPSVTRYGPADAVPGLAPGPPVQAVAEHSYGCLSADQQAAVAAVIRVVTGHRRRPVVLTADRGRGKSAALGIAVGELLRTQRVRRVVVTAPSLHAVETLLGHAAERCDGVVQRRRRMHCATGEVIYRDPEALVDQPERGDLVVVDEAAGLPVDLLTSLLHAASRIAFATTVHGYEGSGRGFDLRFRQVLDAWAPQWRAVRLETPIRWAPQDPLEGWLGRVLCLDAEPATVVHADSAAPVRVIPVSRDELLADETRLRQAFGLLVAAHYRTRPFDLHQLLDAPRRHLFLAEREGAVVGVVLAAEEGGLEAETAQEVWAERRRPHGHLLPQALATHAGLAAAPTGYALRIQRIAVHPALRRRGIGAELVAAVTGRAQGLGCALVGTSFGATVQLVAFWRACGLATVALGARRDVASGEHSALMARGLDDVGRGWVQAAGERLGHSAPALLAEPLGRIDPAVALAAVRAAGRAPVPALASWQRRELEGFAETLRGYAAALPALRALAVALLVEPRWARGRMAWREGAFIGKVLQQRSWAWTAERLAVEGRRPALTALREAVGDSLAD